MPLHILNPGGTITGAANNFGVNNTIPADSGRIVPDHQIDNVTTNGNGNISAVTFVSAAANPVGTVATLSSIPEFTPGTSATPATFGPLSQDGVQLVASGLNGTQAPGANIQSDAGVGGAALQRVIPTADITDGTDGEDARPIANELLAAFGIPSTMTDAQLRTRGGIGFAAGSRPSIRINGEVREVIGITARTTNDAGFILYDGAAIPGLAASQLIDYDVVPATEAVPSQPVIISYTTDSGTLISRN